jgi:serine/threonine protein kinase
MEYIEGTDLSKLVKKNGPLPVATASEYIRQAALGLQHAQERGLIHRDIKPSNLLLVKSSRATDPGTIKVLDLGLAHVDSLTGEEASSTLTESGAVLGTPDFIAPEQAKHSKHVDIRADLYSLGCTYYYLLTGQIPHPGETLGEKLLKHMMDEPLPVEQLRPEVPAGVAGIVRKLMAKRPEDRYQTPKELAGVLAKSLTTGIWPAPSRPASPGKRPTPRRWWLAVGAGAIACLGGLALFLAFAHGSKQPLPSANVPALTTKQPLEQTLAQSNRKPPSRIDEGWINSVVILPPEKQLVTVVDKLKELNPRFDGQVQPLILNNQVVNLEFFTDEITDISPLMALEKLAVLKCRGSGAGKGKLADLSPLKGGRLPRLYWLCIEHNQIRDLSALQGLHLDALYIFHNPIADLTPLKEVKPRGLLCQNTLISDLSPLQGTHLESIDCRGTRVKDLSPLKQTQLKILWCDFNPQRDLEILKSIKTLEKVNDKLVNEFWQSAGKP